MQKLSQVIAVEKGIKERTNQAITALHHASMKADPYQGIDRKYTPIKDGDDVLPPEARLVQQSVPAVLKAVRKQLGELFDITAAKDYANCKAVANLSVDGTAVLTAVPVTYLLFLEKYLTDLRTIVNKLPTLSADEEWTADPSTGLYKSAPQSSVRTSKEQEPIVLFPATDKHPAQTQLITRDRNVGTWTTVKISGAMPVPAKEALLERLERLQRAVKYAREAANVIDAPAINAGDAVLGWIFAGKEG